MRNAYNKFEIVIVAWSQRLKNNGMCSKYKTSIHSMHFPLLIRTGSWWQHGALYFLFIYLFLIVCLFSAQQLPCFWLGYACALLVSSWWQQAIRPLHLSRHVLQLFLGDSKAFPGQMGKWQGKTNKTFKTKKYDTSKRRWHNKQRRLQNG